MQTRPTQAGYTELSPTSAPPPPPLLIPYSDQREKLFSQSRPSVIYSMPLQDIHAQHISEFFFTPITSWQDGVGRVVETGIIPVAGRGMAEFVYAVALLWPLCKTMFCVSSYTEIPSSDEFDALGVTQEEPLSASALSWMIVEHLLKVLMCKLFILSLLTSLIATIVCPAFKLLGQQNPVIQHDLEDAAKLGDAVEDDAEELLREVKTGAPVGTTLSHLWGSVTNFFWAEKKVLTDVSTLSSQGTITPSAHL